MTSHRRQRTTRPLIFVFCEGQTEEEYIKLLRRSFRKPIEVITKVLSTKISSREVLRHLSQIGYRTDKVFLFYDADRDDVLDKIRKIPDAIPLLTNPCVELWFLLHYTEVRRELDSNSIVSLLTRYCTSYKKGFLSDPISGILMREWTTAASRAKMLPEWSNPFSTVYRILEYLDQY